MNAFSGQRRFATRRIAARMGRLGGLVLTLVAVACVPQGQATNVPIAPAVTAAQPLPTPTLQLTAARPTSTPDSQAQLRWLRQTPCVAPCWEGITPGVTSGDEAYTLLKNNPDIVDVELGTKARSDIGYVQWRWKGSDWGGYVDFDAASPSRSVVYIQVLTAVTFTFGEVIDAFGEPSHVWIIARLGPDIGNPIYYFLGLIYLPEGFQLSYFGDDPTVKPTLNADLLFSGVEFFVPSIEGLIGQSALSATDFEQMLVPWQGMRDFDFYCKQRYGDEPDTCEGPSEPLPTAWPTGTAP